MTRFGRLSYERTSLAPSSKIYAEKLSSLGYGKAVYPLDDALGISRLPFKMTLPVMLEMAFESISCESYEQAEQKLKRSFEIQTNDDTMRKVTNAVGSLVFGNDMTLANQIQDALDHGKLELPSTKINGTLYLEVDGAMLPTRNEEQKGISYKEIKLGMAFSSNNIRWRTDKYGKKQHHILKREYTPLIGDVDEFSKLFFSTAIRNGYGQHSNTVLISDGATWIRSMKEKYFPDAQQILDFFHLKEHLFDYAKIIFNNQEEEYKPWVDKITKEFKYGEAKIAINNISKSIKTQYKDYLNSLLIYLKNNIDIINYPSYLQKGYFIGSGAIESANKIVLQRRMKFGAMRWQLASGQAVVTLIGKYRSGLWLSDVVKPTYQKYGEPFNNKIALKFDGLK